VLLEVGDALLAAPLPVLAICPGSREPWMAIGELRARFGDHMLVGAGMVAQATVLEAALTAGAQFVLSPRWDAALAARCVQAGTAYLPGIGTGPELARELAALRAAGCAGVMAVPACRIGTGGTAELAAHLKREWPQALLLAAGGVRPGEVQGFRAAGCAGAVVRGVLGERSRWDMGAMIRSVRRMRG
jgi:2-keto-3-deoxy-6-phosphogluconate aldolase